MADESIDRWGFRAKYFRCLILLIGRLEDCLVVQQLVWLTKCESLNWSATDQLVATVQWKDKKNWSTDQLIIYIYVDIYIDIDIYI